MSQSKSQIVSPYLQPSHFIYSVSTDIIWSRTCIFLFIYSPIYIIPEIYDSNAFASFSIYQIFFFLSLSLSCSILRNCSASILSIFTVSAYIAENLTIISSITLRIDYFSFTTLFSIYSASLSCWHCYSNYFLFSKIRLQLILEGLIIYLYFVIKFWILVLFTMISFIFVKREFTEFIFYRKILSSAFLRSMGSFGRVAQSITISTQTSFPQLSPQSCRWILIPSSILLLINLSISDSSKGDQIGTPLIKSQILCLSYSVKQSHQRYKSPAASSLFLSIILLLFFRLMLISDNSTSSSSSYCYLLAPSSLINLTMVSLFYLIWAIDSWVILFPFRISVKNILRSRTSEAVIELIITELSSLSSFYSYFFVSDPSSISSRLMLLLFQLRPVIGIQFDWSLCQFLLIFFIKQSQSFSVGSYKKSSIFIIQIDSQFPIFLSINSSYLFGKQSQFLSYISCTYSEISVIIRSLYLFSCTYRVSYTLSQIFYSLITCGALPGTLRTKPFKLILGFCLGQFQILGFFSQIFFQFSQISFFDGIFSFLLLLSIKLFEDWRFYFFTPFIYCQVGLGASQTFFSGFSFQILVVFLSKGLDVSLDNSVAGLSCSGISGKVGYRNFLNLGSLFFSATYFSNQLFLLLFNLTPLEYVSENLD